MTEARELAINKIRRIHKNGVSISSDDAMKNQREFVRETAGKIDIDEEAVNDLRLRSMI